jgi:RimJ/RimL family protein N-acetyltransferase
MISLRPLTADDEKMLLVWRNHPEIVRLSATQKTVTTDEHHDWMHRTLRDPNRLVFIVLLDSQPVGIVRYDKNPENESIAEVGIYLMPEHTGHGIGSEALKKSILLTLQKWRQIQLIRAKVREDNSRSISFFKKLCFSENQKILHSKQQGLTCLEASIQTLLNHINSSFYSGLVREHGLSVKSLNWGSAESQAIRFKILSELCDLKSKSLLDIGCGTGDFFRWLNDRHIYVKYTGIDLSQDMIAIASKRFTEARFFVGDISSCELEESYDVIVESGIFTFSTQQIFFDTLQRAFEKCRIGVAFNALSSWSPQQDEGECYLDPAAVLDYCKSLTRRVTLRHDYHPRDFTIYLYKQ